MFLCLNLKKKKGGLHVSVINTLFFVIKILYREYQVIILCDSYWLSIPAGSFIILLQHTQLTMHMCSHTVMESDKQYWSDKISTI